MPDTPVAVNVTVWAVLAVPVMPRLVNVATPLDAVAVEVPTIVAPLLTDAVTARVLDVTVLPPASWIATTGWVVNAEPEIAPLAAVVMPSLLAAPAVTVMVWDTPVSPDAENASVYVPAGAVIARLVNVAVPEEDNTEVVPVSVAPALTVAVTVVSGVPTPLLASCTAMMGCVLMAAPAAAPAAAVVMASLVAAAAWAGCATRVQPEPMSA
ncbi:MAG: hypothetical protein ACKN9D_16960, partial [Actinomycetales bacterium]